MESITPHQKFKISLYEEHLEEASCLYEQRLYLLKDNEFKWIDFERFESRFEAHIDALVIGEELALEVCNQQSTQGDFGELHACVRVFCRQNRLDLVQEVLDNLDFNDKERVKAVIDALKYDLPKDWHDFILALFDKNPNLAAIASEIVGYNRLKIPNIINIIGPLQETKEPDKIFIIPVLRALGRIRPKDCNEFLLKYLTHEDKEVCYEAGFGSSELISISKEQMLTCFEEVVEAIHSEAGLAGVHVCANMDWSLVLESCVDIINFDAYSFFDRFILYPKQIKSFIESGRILAWGIVPTQSVDDIERETIDSLVNKFNEQAQAVVSLGIDMKTILAQSMISPSCGTGALSFKHATKVLELTRGVSEALRKKI